MTKQKLWELIEAYRMSGGSEEHHARKERLDAVLDELLAQPEQEPVAWLIADGEDLWATNEKNMMLDYPKSQVTPLYTTPPQRTWVGLTDADKKTPDMGKYVFLSDDWIDGYRTGLEKGEAKLKEKNHANGNT